jgi:2-dehydro-3-deoxygluconokinase
MASHPYDVLTVGETMLRLSPPGWQRLEQAASLEVQVAGAESNVAVLLSRLGLRTAWVSRLPDNPLGRRIAQALRAHGVDTAHIVWVPEGRVGTFFVEFAPPPRATSVIYDRQHSAMSAMTLAEVDLSLLDQTRLLHLTGITPALSPTCQALVQGLLAAAAQRGVLRSFDVNYRARLWRPEAAQAALEPLCHGVDVLFVTLQDAQRLFGCWGEPAEALRWLHERFQAGITVLTLGEQGAMAVNASGQLTRARVPATALVDPLGSGDAFAASFLSTFLSSPAPDLETALVRGAAAAALKRTIPGDLALLSPDEIHLASQQAAEQVHR